MNKFDNILNVGEWSKEELKQAISYYKVQMNDSRNDNQEMRWLKRSIQKCESLLNPPSEWESLFN
ncbi:hypothetical protein PQE66_gp010 [Bacillus phage PBC2]|uniref:Uncharacterized protein n=1 Tax=Bacillus phage PBC2 TaxID=1675029 RepID=A0A218KBQ7_9CAUD|nr:hypothetical protein PQE66_gp010 [Bacillus phage PBC2]AKQ08325.1 hypothetical protein PBC2_010 [Bacillus phage PBC2]